MTNKIDKFRGLLGKAKDTLIGKGLEQFTSLSRKTQIRVALSLFFGGLALKGVSQVDTNWPANSLNSLEGVVVVPEEWNGQPTDVAEIANRMKAQDDYLGDVWSKYFPTRTWTANSTVETIPMSVYNSIVAPDILHTLTNFFNYMVNNGGINGVPRDPKKDYTFIANKDFGMIFAKNYFRTVPDENQYTSTTAYSENAIGMGTATNPWKHWKAHELGHGLSVGDEAKQKNNNHETKIKNQKEEEKLNHNISVEDIYHLRDDDHPFGKNIPIQVYVNGQWIQQNVNAAKSVMRAGTASGKYVGVETSSPENVISDEDNWVDFEVWDEVAQIYRPARVKKSELQNGAYNTIDKTSDYVINTNPALVHSKPLNNNELPSSPPQLSLNGNMLTITNPNDYPETVRGHKVRYFVYVYHKNNVQNNQYLNTNRPGGYPINETIDLSQFVGQNGVNNFSDLRVRVFGDKSNSLSPATEIEIQNQAPTLTGTPQVSLNGDDATFSHNQPTDPDGDPIDHNEHKIDNTAWESHGTATTFTENNLNKGTHTVKVRAVSAHENMTSNVISTTFTVPDYAPELGGNPTATVNGYDITVNIPPATDANHEDQNFTYLVQIDNQTPVNIGNNLSYTFTNNAPGTHTIKYKAENNQSSPWSNPTTAEVENTAPLPPSNVEASNVQANSATLSWTEGSDNDPGDEVTAYKVDLLLNNQTVASVETPNTTYLANNLLPNQTYVFRVRSKDGNNTYSENFAETSFQTPESENEPPTPPQNPHVVGDVAPTQFTVAWGASTDPDGNIDRYEVYLNGELKETVVPNQALQATLTNALPNASNAVIIMAVDNEGASAAANLSVETPKLPDTTPPNEMNENTFLKDVHAHRVVLTLAQAITDNASDPNQEVSGIDRVEIYVDGVYHSEIANPQVGDTQTVADLNSEQTYTFKYIAIDNEGNQSEFSEEITTDFDGIDENVAGIEVQAYPNPTTDKVKVNLPENAQVKNVMVYNLAGQLVKALETPYFSPGKQVLEIDMTELASGTYLFKIKAANTVFKGKLVRR